MYTSIIGLGDEMKQKLKNIFPGVEIYSKSGRKQGKILKKKLKEKSNLIIRMMLY